jgi:hypothetical protein
MFRRRPPPAVNRPDFDDWAHGFCFWADQSALYFGCDRAEPVASRPVVSLKRTGDCYLVLPGTGQFNPAFFRLRPDDYFVKGKPNTSLKNTYLSYRAESLSEQALTLFATLSHPCRLRIVAWLQQHPGACGHAG